MGMPSNPYEALGLSSVDDLPAALDRQLASFPEWSERLQKADSWIEKLGERTGLPTYHDIFAGTERLREWAREHFPDAAHNDEPSEDGRETGESEDEGEDDDGLPWWWWLGAGTAAGYFIYRKLKNTKVEKTKDIEFEIPGFVFDGVPWTVERTRPPGVPMAARVLDPMLHGGVAAPGPGSTNVIISGRGALTTAHVVGSCPMPDVLGRPHLPLAGEEAWTTTNGSVFVNGAPLLRAGDWVMEQPGGPNPIISGAPRVIAGPPALPCVVQEVTHRRLSEFVPGLESVGSTGGKYVLKFKASASALDVLVTAGAGAAFVWGGPVGKAAAKKMLETIGGPSVTLAVEAESEFFAEFEVPVENRDGELEGVIRYRQVCKGTMTTPEVPLLPGADEDREAEGEDEGIEFDAECERPDPKWIPFEDGE